MTTPQSPKHTNGFDCLRLLAAAAVLFSHCYYLLGIGAREPLQRGGDGPNIGFVAVYVFFAISGYLVTYSWQRDPDLRRFLARRALRILPGLIFVIVLSFAVVGPLTTSLDLKSYFSSSAAWSYLLKILIYPTQYGLPGVFTSNPMPSIVNGSLWSLRVEFSLYVIIALIGIFGLLRNKDTGTLCALLCYVGYVGLGEVGGTRSIPGYDKMMIFLPSAVTFFCGVAMAENNVKFKRPALTAAALVILTALIFPTHAFKYTIVLTTPFLALLAAQNARCNLSRFGDYSYGIYLWAYVVQQTLMHFFPAISFIELLGSAGATALIMAALSWHLVEKKALGFKPKKPGAGPKYQL